MCVRIEFAMHTGDFLVEWPILVVAGEESTGQKAAPDETTDSARIEAEDTAGRLVLED